MTDRTYVFETQMLPNLELYTIRVDADNFSTAEEQAFRIAEEIAQDVDYVDRPDWVDLRTVEVDATA